MRHIPGTRKTAAGSFIIGVSLLAAVAACSPPAFSADREPRVKISLLADCDSIVPGEKFRLGLLFEIADGWHIYWRNPGDAGLQPVIDWKLPEGFSMEPLQWPVPVRLEESGELYVNAYKDEILLYAWVHPPAGLAVSRADFRAGAVWLVCRSVCVQEGDTARLSLPVGSSGAKAGKSSGLFDRYARLVPRGVEDYPFLSLDAGWVESPGIDSRTRVAGISLECLSEGLRFLTGKADVQWFGDPSDLLYSDELEQESGPESPEKLALKLPVRTVEVPESWPQAWGGVLTVKMSRAPGDTLTFALTLRFTD
ncbi:MAG: hypothetical protein JXQ83_08230 [Candidatus Glassbacteria bacterium]|nr:hypothetical protein [Candidatus Glassbacteria bacterium]